MKDDLLLEALNLTNSPSERLLFYNGEVELFYNDEVHAYYRVIDGERVLVPGSTTITGMVDKSGPLMWWAVGCAIDHLIEHSSNPELLRTAYYAVKNKDFIGDELKQVAGILATGSIYDLATLLNDARCAHNRLVKEASNIGHDVHSWLEGLLSSAATAKCVITQEFVNNYSILFPQPNGDEQQRCCNLAINWLIRHEVQPLLVEKKVMSREYNYAGTLDWLAMITRNGKRIKELGDFKTSRSLHYEYRMQVASYCHALTEEFSEHNDIESCTIMRLGKDDGSFETWEKPIEEIREIDFNGFLGALQTYNWFKQLDLIEKAKRPLKTRRYGKKTRIVIPEPVHTEIPIG